MSPLPVDLGDGALLRRLVPDDVEEMWMTVERELDRLAIWMPWASLNATIEGQRSWLESVSSAEDSLEGCGLFVDGRFVGGVGLMPGKYGIAAEIGYWIDSEHEGRGLVTRAVEALIGIGFDELRVHRIVIRCGVDNDRSCAIPERLGFTREGVERGGGLGSAGYYDHYVYSLLRDEWPR